MSPILVSLARRSVLLAAALSLTVVAFACRAEPTPTPTLPRPTATPTALPTATPTLAPTPTAFPTPTPTATPVPTPTPTPTRAPTPTPTATPTPVPTPTPTPLPASLFLSVTYPADRSEIRTADILVIGRTSPDATVTVNGQVARVGADGTFSAPLRLNAGPSQIDVIASNLAGQSRRLQVLVVYTP